VLSALALAAAGLGVGVPLSQALRPGGHRPVAYEVTYAVVVSPTPGSVTRHEELLAVRRPLRAAELSFPRLPGPRRRAVAGDVSSPDALYDVAGGRLEKLAGRELGPGSGDEDLPDVLPALARRGLARFVGTSRVAGRSCTTWELGEPPSGAITKAPTPEDHDELCLSADGLLLSERWTYHGRVVLVRTATEVSLDPSGLGRLLSVAGAAPSPGPAPQASMVAHATSFLAPPPTPRGFRRAGLERIAYPDPTDPARLLYQAVLWAFTTRSRVVTVEAGVGAVPWTDPGSAGEQVRLSGLGPATSVLSSFGPELEVVLPGGRFVRVRGTVPPATLEAFADELRLAR
jgi:hypothetical protein